MLIMHRHAISRRDILKATTALPLIYAARAATPPAEALAPAPIEAARREGTVVCYTSAASC
jgi:hypothetical protein